MDNLLDFEKILNAEHKEPKDKKCSIREKYNRRLRSLSHVIEEYVFSANERLENGGNIRNRDETEKILNKAKELQDLIPSHKEIDIQNVHISDELLQSLDIK